MKQMNMLEELFTPPKENHFYKILNILLEMGIQNAAADEGSLLLYRQEERELEFKIVVGNKSRNLMGQRVPVGEGITGSAALAQETLIGSRNESRRMYEVKNDGHPFSVMASPILLDDEVIGVITAVKFSEGAVFRSGDSFRYDMLSYTISEFLALQLELTELKHPKKKMNRLSASQQQIVLNMQQLMEKFPEKENEFGSLLNTIGKILG